MARLLTCNWKLTVNSKAINVIRIIFFKKAWRLLNNTKNFNSFITMLLYVMFKFDLISFLMIKKLETYYIIYRNLTRKIYFYFFWKSVVCIYIYIYTLHRIWQYLRVQRFFRILFLWVMRDKNIVGYTDK